MKRFLLSLPVLASSFAITAYAAPKPAGKPAAKTTAKTAPKPSPKTVPKPAPNAVKGQAQLAGGAGQFGTVYSLENGFNCALLAARYTLTSLPTPSKIFASHEQKLLVVDFSLKNATPGDAWFDSNEMLTAVDQNGQLYPMGDADVVLKSQGVKTSLTLRPGQGMGQGSGQGSGQGADTLSAVLLIPNNARIVKLMLNRKRLNSNEETIRYFVAGATKAEAGAEGDPKNSIAPLPDGERDPADASGATALKVGKGAIGKAFASRFMNFKIEEFGPAPTGTMFKEQAPEEGKKYVIATITASAPVEADGADFVGGFYWPGGGDDAAIAELVDSDGEKYAAWGARKAKRDEDFPSDSALKAGESRTYRVFWAIPKDATPKTLTLGASQARQWNFDLAK